MGKDKTSKKNQSSNPPVPAAGRSPSWPPFKPPLPIVQLNPEAPVPGLGDKIILLRNFWPKTLCRDYVNFLKTLPLATTPGRPKRGEALRVNDRFQIDDARFAEKLWLETGLKDALLDESSRHLWGGDAVGLNPNIRVYRYSRGQYFDCHYDDSNLVTLQSRNEPSGTINTKTTWTLLLYLTSAAEGCVGGETVFYPLDRKSPKEEIAIAPETGLLLLHKHGEDCLLARQPVIFLLSNNTNCVLSTKADR
ncbi:uncharacterized protein F4812DRAFT_463528 [Daldinia caldariorum]|uniref:uncharacterized protein n=1 Tax=Daldinia caldariorum TaxID=326644 RepID=UPI0020080A63|nr:uncharacterized protein F4812DRAFT_463528 [Daldinia caldariorum]KAI1463700.1 hypothetical protein F4812DRAFT_463528 [Daldinia caldariorum]